MAHHGVPGVGIAVIDRGRLHRAGGFGTADRERDTTAQEQTLFQAASMSKPVAAAALLRAVDQGHFELDAPINDYLSAWRIADNDLTRDRPVTLRRILSHTAGLTVWGFEGYTRGAPLPSRPLLAENVERFFSPDSLYDIVFRLDGEGIAKSLAVVDGERNILEGTRADQHG